MTCEDLDSRCTSCNGSGIDPSSWCEALPCFDCNASGSRETQDELDWWRNRGM